MSASKPRALWRLLQAVLRGLGLGHATHLHDDGARSGVAVLRVPSFDYATVTITPVPDWLAAFRAVEQATAAKAAAVRQPPAVAVSPSAKRPLAGQLAVTSAQNLPKGRKRRHGCAPIVKPQSAAALPRRASVIKAMPVLRVAKKKPAPKRRHVWLSTQVRVIRPIVSNVVSLEHANRGLRPGGRQAGPKLAGRAQRLAA